MDIELVRADGRIVLCSYPNLDEYEQEAVSIVQANRSDLLEHMRTVQPRADYVALRIVGEA